LEQIIRDIRKERMRQDRKWGEQNHPLEKWTGILGEEYGELCQAINETIFDNGTDLGGYKNIRKEAIQVAAVAISIIQCMDRTMDTIPI
jgi:NTP pyrophosphatase (non-canonical NTP hydrolase)